MVRTEGGAVVLGARGVHRLADDSVEGEDPLAHLGPRAADHLRRLDGFANVGDLLLNSSYDRELQEVAAFEELVGSHGGLGGPQNRPFLLHPAELTLEEHLVGAPAVHQLLQRWASELDVRAPLPSPLPEPLLAQAERPRPGGRLAGPRRCRRAAAGHHRRLPGAGRRGRGRRRPPGRGPAPRAAHAGRPGCRDALGRHRHLAAPALGVDGSPRRQRLQRPAGAARAWHAKGSRGSSASGPSAPSSRWCCSGT